MASSLRPARPWQLLHDAAASAAPRPALAPESSRSVAGVHATSEAGFPRSAEGAVASGPGSPTALQIALHRSGMVRPAWAAGSHTNPTAAAARNSSAVAAIQTANLRSREVAALIGALPERERR